MPPNPSPAPKKRLRPVHVEAVLPDGSIQETSLRSAASPKTWASLSKVYTRDGEFRLVAETRDRLRKGSLKLNWPQQH